VLPIWTAETQAAALDKIIGGNSMPRSGDGTCVYRMRPALGRRCKLRLRKIKPGIERAASILRAISGL